MLSRDNSMPKKQKQTKKMTLRFSEELGQKLKIAAFLEEISINKLILQLIEEYLQKHGQ